MLSDHSLFIRTRRSAFLFQVGSANAASTFDDADMFLTCL